MAKQVPWTREVFETFCREAMLNEEEIYIMESRIKGTPISQQAMHLNCSESRISTTIANLKRMYDIVQRYNSDKLPKRVASSKELWMDNH